MISRVARVNSSHPYLENDSSSSLVSHRLRISPWLWFRRYRGIGRGGGYHVLVSSGFSRHHVFEALCFGSNCDYFVGSCCHHPLRDCCGGSPASDLNCPAIKPTNNANAPTIHTVAAAVTVRAPTTITVSFSTRYTPTSVVTRPMAATVAIAYRINWVRSFLPPGRFTS